MRRKLCGYIFTVQTAMIAKSIRRVMVHLATSMDCYNGWDRFGYLTSTLQIERHEILMLEIYTHEKTLKHRM